MSERKIYPFPQDRVRKSQATLDAEQLATVKEQAFEIDALVSDFNRQHMVVNEAGKVVVFQQAYDPMLNRTVYHHMTFADFERAYSNRRLPVTVGDQVKYNTASKIWLGHAKRRQYLGGILFDPSGTQRDGVLNLWQGYAVQPRRGSWNRLREHIWAVLCNEDEKCWNYLMKWMARMVQQPALLGEAAVVLCGLQGSGKSTLGKVLTHIIGQHAVPISNPEHLTGKFNAHLRDCLLLVADECFFAGNRAHVGVLKSLVTSDRIMNESKGFDATPARSFLHLLMTSNEQWVIPAELSDRRFFVLDVSNERIGDRPYFAAIWQELESGGYEAMLNELLSINLVGFDVRDIPQTEGLQNQKQQSLDLDYRWWQDVLHRGYVYDSKLGLQEDFQIWLVELGTNLLFDAYEAYAMRHHHRHPLNRITFGRHLRKLGCQPCKPGRVLDGEHMAEQVAGSGRVAAPLYTRRPSYRLGTLDEARRDYCKRTNLTIDWDGD